ncbi:MAG: hypothetical protein EXX96DRAFT_477915 [Benjaminiella poitrasii]|nr:MAG: hypothetical protein EXX96DRAFT_477915 [Benjaminiella poitrasii]
MTVSLPTSNLESRSTVFDYQATNSTTFIAEEYRTHSISSSSPSLVSPSSSINNSLFEICHCCGKQDCESLDYFNQLIKKLETDTRLAAELGQGLLNKHESYVKESSKQRTRLQEQLEECHERIRRLELISDEMENEKETILKEKNKWLWEYQKSKKILDETIADLELSNDKCLQLSKELDLKSNEVEKLRIFKFMMKQSESREELLSSKLKDTNQELTICRKNELLLESKIKKLKTKYESLYLRHEQLTKEIEKPTNNSSYRSNKNNNIDSSKLMTAIASSSNNNTDDLISVIKELSLTNTKLKADLIDYKEQLTDAKEEIMTLNHKIEEYYNSSTMSSSDMTKSPFTLLQEHATQVLDRLRSSDIRVLNRRLKRAFDIAELSNMSNSIIDNILMDVDTLESRFLWIKDKQSISNDMMVFFPLVDLLKSMLKELGNLKTTMNDLQVEYVKKVEENKTRVEEEIMKKSQQQSANEATVQQTVTLRNLKRRSSARPLSWFSSMFSVSSSNIKEVEAKQDEDDKQERSTISAAATNSSISIMNDNDGQRNLSNSTAATTTVKSLLSSQPMPTNHQQKRQSSMSYYFSSTTKPTSNNDNLTIPIIQKNIRTNCHNKRTSAIIVTHNNTIIPSAAVITATNTHTATSWLGGK